MTVVTIKVKLSNPEPSTKARVLMDIGQIAEALHEVMGIEIIDVSDDFVPAGLEPLVPAKARKPRGPNKPKADASPVSQSEQIEAHEIPGFLKRS